MSSFSDNDHLVDNSLDVQTNIPRHVAIIMDGNRRWAKKKFLPIGEGHRKGAETLTKIVEVASKLGVKILTVFAFSTENWSRPNYEISILLDLLKLYLLKEKRNMIKNGIRLESIGDLNPFPDDVKKILEETKKETSSGDKIQLVLALNYGGRDDLKRAMRGIAADIKEAKLEKDDVTEELISSRLDTARFGDPDLFIRSSGEKRVSNFLLWQISYSELFLTDVLWPDFGEKDFYEAVSEYQKRERRLGA
ncbi:MAG: isoprenyl transferase [Chlamydiae bacterium]|jgi:undecaprenyl diphosphate synthase|nr:isoprenyl transferase [Chlamydiota bacterium]